MSGEIGLRGTAFIHIVKKGRHRLFEVSQEVDSGGNLWKFSSGCFYTLSKFGSRSICSK